MQKIPLNRIQGCLLGLAVGDALGATYEGLFADIILSYGGGDEIVKHKSGETLNYTDDTQMMIGVAETLVEHREIVPGYLCQRFAQNYQKGRGYGQGVRPLIEAMAIGEFDQKTTPFLVFENGSYGNGAAMRIAPVGLLFHDDKLVEQSDLASKVTHAHDLGLDGARIISKAVNIAARMDRFDRIEFFNELISVCATEEFKWQLKTARDLPAFSSVSFGNGLEAHESVVTSLVCFADSSRDFPGTISRAIGTGGDVDTIAAMAGAISGAFLGVEVIPENLIECLENGPQGKDYLFELAEKI